MKYKSLYFSNGKLRILDQTKLPNNITYVECSTYNDVYSAIKSLQVRGAPAIGLAAAYGVVLASENMIRSNGQEPKSWAEASEALSQACEYLCSSRPTAVNLRWACDRMLSHVNGLSGKYDVDYLRGYLLQCANKMYDEDQTACGLIGKFGAKLIRDGMQILTYCNAGSLATSELGTALAPIYTAHKDGKRINVYCCETRPVLQGARLTAWELMQEGLNPTLICDNMAAQLMREKRVDMIIVGADRIAANGDTANKIGTYGLAVIANYHLVPFYVAAPISTFDLKMKNGKSVPIELRHPHEVTMIGKERVAPNVPVYNPAFDITPFTLITGIITEHGLVAPVTEDKILEAVK